MTTESTDILTAALNLPHADRLQIAESLFASVAPKGMMSADDPASIAELERRLNSSDDELISHEEAMRRVRQTLAARKREREQS